MGANLRAIIVENVDKSSRMMTDDFSAYTGRLKDFAGHGVINHSRKEYVNGDIHTNTVEGFFSILKRGIIGVYQHVDSNHLHRYLSEFNFRYNERKTTDAERSEAALIGIEGKRLTYRDS
jgi:hypothetical protein